MIEQQVRLDPVTQPQLTSKEVFDSGKFGSIYQLYTVWPEILSSSRFATVRKCTHKKSNQTRAVKSIKTVQMSESQIHHIINQAALQKQLDHINIVKVFDCFVEESYVHVVMELCEGGRLVDRHVRDRRLGEAAACRVMRELLAALVYCHEQGVYHLHLSLASLLLQDPAPDAALKVTGFGKTLPLLASDEDVFAACNPHFVAPEQTFNRSYSSTDVWSCGVLLYLMLAGVPPFFAASREQVLSLVRIGRYQVDRPELRHVSQQCKALLVRLLDYDPGKRWSSKKALDDLWFEDTLVFQKNQAQAAPEIAENLRSFAQQSELQQLINFTIAQTSLGHKQKQQLLQAFKAYDRNKDGTVSREELWEAMKTHGSLARDEVDEIFKRIDKNGSGQINFSGSRPSAEFLAANLEFEQRSRTQHIKTCFRQIDLVRLAHPGRQRTDLSQGTQGSPRLDPPAPLEQLHQKDDQSLRRRRRRTGSSS